VLNFFRKKNTLKLNPGLVLCLDFVDEAGSRILFESEIIECQKRRLVLQPPARSVASKLNPGLKVTISAVQEEQIFLYEGTLVNVGNALLEATLPVQLEDAPLPKPVPGVKFELTLPVQYRALRTHHTQNGETVAITGNSLFLSSRVGIPTNTDLLLNLTLPYKDKETTVGLTGKSLTSSPHNKRFVTEIELAEGEPEQLKTLWNFSAVQNFKSTRSIH
jgi:hypothetical protein